MPQARDSPEWHLKAKGLSAAWGLVRAGARAVMLTAPGKGVSPGLQPAEHLTVSPSPGEQRIWVSYFIKLISSHFLSCQVSCRYNSILSSGDIRMLSREAGVGGTQWEGGSMGEKPARAVGYSSAGVRIRPESLRGFRGKKRLSAPSSGLGL